MQVQLFGVGTKSLSPAITAQRRINCYAELRQEPDTSSFNLIGRPGLAGFSSALGSPSRGMWAVNTLSTPLLFTVHFGTLYSIDNAGTLSIIGVIGTTAGDVYMADDGKYLVLVDGSKGYWYNMQTPGALTLIVDGNFTTTPETVVWQDNYFIVTSSATRQFQLSQISPSIDPAVWPAVQINFTGSGAGALQGAMPQHNVLNLFADVYSEFWQDTGSPDFPYAKIPGSAAEFGLVSTASLAKFDNSIVGLFRNDQGGVNVSRLAGFSLKRISNSDIDQIISNYSYGSASAAQGYSFMQGGHPFYVLSFPDNTTWMYDGATNIWSEWQGPNNDLFYGKKFAVFQGRLLVSDYHNGNIYQFAATTYDDNGSMLPMEIWSKRIYNENKWIGISNLEIEVEAGVGLVLGQGVDPQMDLQVSKDGGNSFTSIGYSSLGMIGEYTQRVKWTTLGAARNWVLRLRITDPVKRVLTGARAEIVGASF